MTDEQLDQYWKELNTPYSKEELELHLQDRELKGLLEITHYNNFCLQRLAQQWIDFVNGKCERPSRNIWSYLVPGRNQVNSACDRLQQIVEEFSAREYHSIPAIPIMFFCSRSTQLLIQSLAELYYTPHLDTAESSAKDFFSILVGGSERNLTRKQLHEVLMGCVNRFVEACEANAKDLHKYLLDFINGKHPSRPATSEVIAKIAHEQKKQGVLIKKIDETTTQLNNRDKKRRNRTKATHSANELEQIHNLWITAQGHPRVKEGSKHKPSYAAALQYFAKEFHALNVRTEHDLRKALKAWSRKTTPSK